MGVFEKVSDVLKELSGVEEILLKNSLTDELNLDSLGMVTLIIELEDAFSITFQEEDLNPFALETVNDIVDLVNKYVGGSDEEEKS